jgi:6-phosphogluconolactonase (cycloisomerase 2 family)
MSLEFRRKTPLAAIPVFLFASLIWLAGCEEDDSKTKAQTVDAPEMAFVYAANFASGDLSSFEVNMDEQSAETLADGQMETPSQPYDIAVHPDGDRMFVTTSEASSGTIYNFSLDPETGALEEEQTIPNYDTSHGLAVSPDGEFLFVGAQLGAVINTFEIDAGDGTLTDPGVSVFASTSEKLVVHPNGNFIYNSVAEFGAYEVERITVANDGTFTGYNFSGSGQNATHLAIDPIGDHIYVTDYDEDELTIFSINDSTGNLTQVGSPKSTGSNPAGVVVTPDGAFVIVGTQDGIEVYARNTSTGALNEIPDSPFPAGTSPWGLAIDATGQLLAVADSLDDTIRLYDVDEEDGELTEYEESELPAGTVTLAVKIVNQVTEDEE